MNGEVPSELDWEDYQSDLDKKYAYQFFAGKTNLEMQSEFFKNVISRATDLRFMPMKPFRYYMVGFKEFIEKGEFDKFSASDTVSCFLKLIEEKLDKNPDFIAPIMDKLMPTAEKIANNQDLYDADVDIYGSFPDVLARIKSRLLSMEPK